MYHAFLADDGKKIFLREHRDAQCVSLIGQIPYPLRFGYGFTLPASGLSTDDDSFDAGKIYCADVVKHGLKGHIVMPAADMLP